MTCAEKPACIQVERRMAGQTPTFVSRTCRMRMLYLPAANLSFLH